ncbi:MAG: hypothetical protein Ta2B_24020 [Termitinemataceae bacterium]|nr:MAG: hypothetical protein Ta2B_24020 [Termitinemataceae bacterium]
MEIVKTNHEWRDVADEIWASMDRMDKITEETKKLIKETAEQMKETDRKMKETAEQMKETDRKMQETGRQVGALTNSFGKTVEYMVVPNLVKKFRELGFEFEKTQRDVVIRSIKHNIFTEVDAFLEDGDKVMVVEIKNKVKTDDINDHIERMEKLRKDADFHNDKRKYLGAIAGVIFDDNEKTYALKKGFYVIEPSGETFNITTPSGKYKPHEW